MSDQPTRADTLLALTDLGNDPSTDPETGYMATVVLAAAAWAHHQCAVPVAETPRPMCGDENPDGDGVCVLLPGHSGHHWAVSPDPDVVRDERIKPNRTTDPAPCPTPGAMGHKGCEPDPAPSTETLSRIADALEAWVYDTYRIDASLIGGVQEGVDAVVDALEGSSE